MTHPDGLTIPTSATVDLATVSGTWVDQYSNSGTFLFSPPQPVSGPPRRIAVTGRIAAGHQQPTAVAGLSFSPFSFGTTLAAAPAVNILGAGDRPTTNCPGTVANPRALAGQLCVYLSVRQNVALISILDLNGNVGADRSGASLLVLSNNTGESVLYGRWAVAIP